MLIFDAHLDLSLNALEWNRDYTRPLREIREREQGQTDREDRGNGTVCGHRALLELGSKEATVSGRPELAECQRTVPTKLDLRTHPYHESLPSK